MQDILSMLQTVHRPRLMMRAARIGAQDYKRHIHLPRLLGFGVLPGQGAALLKLMEIETGLEQQRVDGDASYNMTRHLDLLIAMVAEARLLGSSRAPAQPSAVR